MSDGKRVQFPLCVVLVLAGALQLRQAGLLERAV
jgi:hypothetical protein